MLKAKLKLDAAALDAQMQQLNVALAELDTVKPKMRTYGQRGNVFFASKRDALVKSKQAELKATQDARYAVGLQIKAMEQS